VPTSGPSRLMSAKIPAVWAASAVFCLIAMLIVWSMDGNSRCKWLLVVARQVAFGSLQRRKVKDTMIQGAQCISKEAQTIQDNQRETE
jgi:hypothetical protein